MPKFQNASNIQPDPRLQSLIQGLHAGQSMVWTILSDSTGVLDSSADRTFYDVCQALALEMDDTVRTEFLQFDTVGQNVYTYPRVLRPGSAGERYMNFLSGSAGRSISLTPASVNEGSTVSIDRQWEFRIDPVAATGPIECIMAHQGGPGSRGWSIRKLANGDIPVSWHPDPASETAQTFTILAANLAITPGTPADFKVVLDADNGASGYTVTAYKSLDQRRTWSQIQTATVATATSVGNPAAVNYEVGARSSSIEPFNGKIYRAQYREGIDGAPMFPEHIEQWGTTNSGSATLEGSPTLRVLCGAVAGKNLQYFMGVTGGYVGSGAATSDGTDRFRKLVPVLSPGLVTLSTGHNEANCMGYDMTLQLDTWDAATLARAPQMFRSLSTQNPQKLGTSVATPLIVHRHMSRINTIRGWALNKGLLVFDVWNEFFIRNVKQDVLINADGVHPQIPDGYVAASRAYAKAWGITQANVRA